MEAGEEDRVQLAKRWEEMIYSKIQQRERGKKKKKMATTTKSTKMLGSWDLALRFICHSLILTDKTLLISKSRLCQDL